MNICKKFGEIPCTWNIKNVLNHTMIPFCASWIIVAVLALLAIQSTLWQLLLPHLVLQLITSFYSAGYLILTLHHFVNARGGTGLAGSVEHLWLAASIVIVAVLEVYWTMAVCRCMSYLRRVHKLMVQNVVWECPQNCVKFELDQNYRELESEFQNDFKTKVHECFADNVRDSRMAAKCTLFPGEMDMDAFGPSGPLRACSICQTVARYIRNAYINMPVDELVPLPDPVKDPVKCQRPYKMSCVRVWKFPQRCVRKHVMDALGISLKQCVKEGAIESAGASLAHNLDDNERINRNNVTSSVVDQIGTLPDFDEYSDFIRDEVMTTINSHVVVSSRLDFCLGANPARHQNTASCMQKPYQGYLKGHCAAINGCRGSFSSPLGACGQTFPSIESSTCSCIEMARNEAKRRLTRLQNVLVQAVGQQADGANVHSSLETDGGNICATGQVANPVCMCMAAVSAALLVTSMRRLLSRHVNPLVM